MAQRITDSFLETQCANLNRLTNSPMMPYLRGEDGELVRDDKQQLTSLAGHFSISRAYGGVALHRKVESGGEEDVFRRGHISKRQLADLMGAFAAGYYTKEQEVG